MVDYQNLYFFCIAILLLSFLSIRLFINIAPKLGFVDIPNERSSHKDITPRGAGIVFGLLFILGTLIYEINTRQNITNLYVILFAIFIVYITGLIDDKKEISAKTKFLFIIAASIIAFYQGISINSLGIFFGYDLELHYLALPFTILVIVGLTNAINLSDGLDGLAGSISAITLSALLCIGIIYNDSVLIVWSGILISVILGFLILNWYPARVFMGDTGSLTLGFVISLLTIKSLEHVNSVSTLFLMAVPVLDTLIVFRRRMQRGQSPFKADKNHLHHILNNIKQDKAYTVKMLIMMQFVFCCMFIQLHNQDNVLNLVIFLFLFLIFFGLFDPRMKRRGKKAKLRKRYQRELNLKSEKNKCAV